MNAELTVLISLGCVLIGALLGIAGYKRNVLKDRRQEGMLLTQIGYIKSGIDDIKAEQREQRDQYNKLTERVARVEAAVASAHKRLDGHGI